MMLAAEAFSMLRHKHKKEPSNNPSDDACDHWYDDQSQHLSLLIHSSSEDLVCLTAEAVVALVQSVAGATQQSLSE